MSDLEFEERKPSNERASEMAVRRSDPPRVYANPDLVFEQTARDQGFSPEGGCVGPAARNQAPAPGAQSTNTTLRPTKVFLTAPSIS